VEETGGNWFFVSAAVNGGNVLNTTDILLPEDIFSTFCLHQVGGSSEWKPE
jgi:hypothetical protein